MSNELAFNINYPVVEITCLDAGCMGKVCRAVHRRHTGDATLTVVGAIEVIQRIASEIIPGWPDPVPPVEQPWAQVHRSHGPLVPGAFDCERCERCGQVVISANGTTPMGAAQCPIGVTTEDRKALSREDLQRLQSGAVVMAGGFADDQRNDRTSWSKLHSGRWQTARHVSVDGNAGVSSSWLANNRNPMLDT